MELPIINHPDYVAKINDDNKFPIQKFGALAEHLIKEKVVKKFYIHQEGLEKTWSSVTYISPKQNVGTKMYTAQTEDAFDKVMNNNIKSNHLLCQMVIPEMTERKDGSIIIVSSIGGLKSSTVLGTYIISKAADIMLVKNLAAEFGPQNVRTNAIAPGLFKTDFARALWENPEILKQSTATCPLRRIGEPDEIGGAAVFLASDAGTFVNGHTLVIDGGSTA